MENERKLQTIYQECMQELESIGIYFKSKKIQIQVSKRNNKRYGCCKPELPNEKYKKIKRKGFRYIIKYDDYQKYTIEISPWVMNLKKDIIKNTVIHELIHCMPYCLNHGKEFKKYANIIKEKLGYEIRREGNKKEDFKESNIEYIEDNEYNYKIQCIECGQIYYRKRLNKNFIKNYRCGKCKGKLKVVSKNK